MPLVVEGSAPDARRADALERDLRSLMRVMETHLSAPSDGRDSHPTLLDLSASETEIEQVKNALTRYGSDKVSGHSYESAYAGLFHDRDSVKRVLEVGIGSIDPTIPSYLDAVGAVSGASLQAWRDLYPNAQIVGADIDRSCFFEDERITCRFVDQLDLEVLEQFSLELRTEFGTFDLIIDDGLHEPFANFNTALTLYPLLSPGGYLVIEDVNASLRPIYEGCLGGLLVPAASLFVDLRTSKSGADNCLYLVKAPG
jgi:hypothetical protein